MNKETFLPIFLEKPPQPINRPQNPIQLKLSRIDEQPKFHIPENFQQFSTHSPTRQEVLAQIIPTYLALANLDPQLLNHNQRIELTRQIASSIQVGNEPFTCSKSDISFIFTQVVFNTTNSNHCSSHYPNHEWQLKQGYHTKHVRRKNNTWRSIKQWSRGCGVSTQIALSLYDHS
jgi:hypothetical protein